jgi:predicted AlkP superfamily phosphohydrolase/phosphomutase
MHDGTGGPSVAGERRYDRVFLLELSGPTIEFIRERADRLPNFRRMLEQGAWAELEGPLQPVAPLSYGTLLTGQNPGKTGLYDFFRFPAGGYDRVPYDLTHLGAEPLFRTLSSQGRRVGLLNVPLTHPLPEVRGFVVSGDEGVGDDFAWPEEVRARLDAMGYTVPFGASYAPGREQEFLARALEVAELRHRAFRELFAEQDWDFGMVTLHLYGELQHAFWKFYDPRHPRHQPLGEALGGRDPFLEGLEAADRLLGDAFEAVGPRGLVLFAGAWGHRLEHTRVSFNTLLRREGWLRFRRSPGIVLKSLVARTGFSMTAAERLAHRLNLWKLFHYGLPRGKRAALTGAAFLSLGDIDWSRTRAVAMGYLGQIFLNVRGTRPHGAIDPADVPQERDRLVRLLEALRDPRTGERVVERVHRREEIYAGPELAHAPDLIVELREGWSGDASMGQSDDVFSESPPNHSSDHHNLSAFLACGPGVPAGRITARLQDVAPTVLRALGVPLPPDLDGSPLPIFHEARPGAGAAPVD